MNQEECEPLEDTGGFLTVHGKGPPSLDPANGTPKDQRTLEHLSYTFFVLFFK